MPFKTNSRVYFPVDPAQRFQTFLANDREKYTSGIPGMYRTPLYYILLNPSESSLSRFMLSLNCALPLCTDYDVTPQGKKEGKKRRKNNINNTRTSLSQVRCGTLFMKEFQQTYQSYRQQVQHTYELSSLIAIHFSVKFQF